MLEPSQQHPSEHADTLLNVVQPGSTHTISARAFVRDHHGPGLTRTLRNRFTGCSTPP
jgi:hypothetical protein